jgi:hypothetical protein
MHLLLAAACQDVRTTFESMEVTASDRTDGSVVVVLHDVEIGGGWNQPIIDLAVKLQPTFPSTPPYPFYAPPGLARTDGRTYSPLQPQVDFEGEKRTQISFNNKPFQSEFDTLGARFTAIVHWLRNPA